MKCKIPESRRDIEECREKLMALLTEYRCSLITSDEWSSVLLLDKDTDETIRAVKD